MSNTNPTHELISRTGKGEYRGILSKEYENAIILDCGKTNTSVTESQKTIEKAIEAKRPLIIEDIGKIIQA